MYALEVGFAVKEPLDAHNAGSFVNLVERRILPNGVFASFRACETRGLLRITLGKQFKRASHFVHNGVEVLENRI